MIITYIIELSVALVTHKVFDWVGLGNLSLVFRALLADAVAAAFAYYFFVTDSKKAGHTESRLTQRAFIYPGNTF